VALVNLLFGIGFTIQFARMQQLAADQASRLYLRRLLVLLAMGLLHAAVFWTGDVLHVYAVLGLILLLVLRNASDRAILGLIVACLLYPVASGVLRLLLMTPDVTAALVAQAKAMEAANNLAYGQGNFLDAAHQHTRDLIYMYDNIWSLWGTLGFYVQMATTMLIGVLIGRHHVPERIPEFLPAIRRLHWWAFGVGVACDAEHGVRIAPFGSQPRASPGARGSP